MTFETKFVSDDPVRGGSARKTIILVQRNDPDSDAATNSRKLSELRELAHAAEYDVAGAFVQSRLPDRKYQIGCGKVDELVQMVKSLDAEKVIFNNPLSMTQIYNISEMCSCEVIDRFQLILEIFAARATTKRAKLQVELAELQYKLPKTKAILSLMKKDKQGGFMGLGGYENSYEQDIKKRIARIRAELQQGGTGVSRCVRSGMRRDFPLSLWQGIRMRERVRFSNHLSRKRPWSKTCSLRHSLRQRVLSRKITERCC